MQNFLPPNLHGLLTTTDAGWGMNIGGFKLGRYLAWIRVVRQVRGWRGIGRAVVTMGRAIRSGRVERKVWRERIRYGCLKCPIRTGHVCEVVDGDRVFGCGCYVPFKAMAKAPYPKGCWAKQNAPESGLGWVNCGQCRHED